MRDAIMRKGRWGVAALALASAGTLTYAHAWDSKTNSGDITAETVTTGPQATGSTAAGLIEGMRSKFSWRITNTTGHGVNVLQIFGSPSVAFPAVGAVPEGTSATCPEGYATLEGVGDGSSPLVPTSINDTPNSANATVIPAGGYADFNVFIHVDVVGHSSYGPTDLDNNRDACLGGDLLFQNQFTWVEAV